MRIVALVVFCLAAWSAFAAPAQKTTVCKEGDTRVQYSQPALHQEFLVLSEVATPEKCVSGKWVYDKEADDRMKLEQKREEEKEAAIQKHRLRLWNALRTRVISDAEMKEVLELGTQLIPEDEGGYTGGGCMGDCTQFEIENAQRLAAAETVLNNALLNQFKMRTFQAEKEKSASTKDVDPDADH
jgi:hypothetical protein